MMDRGVGVDTLETAASWAKLDALYAATVPRSKRPSSKPRRGPGAQAS